MTNAVEITLSDLRELRTLLDAVLTLLTARDIMEAQARLQPHRPSALAVEVERLKIRTDSYMADYLLAQQDAEEGEESDNGDAVMGEPEPDFEEALSGAPLGERSFPRQTGRRLTVEEVRLGAPTAIVTEPEAEED